MVEEFIVWRPLMAGKITMMEIKEGIVDLVDLMKLNALLDHEAALNSRGAGK